MLACTDLVPGLVRTFMYIPDVTAIFTSFNATRSVWAYTLVMEGCHSVVWEIISCMDLSPFI